MPSLCDGEFNLRLLNRLSFLSSFKTIDPVIAIFFTHVTGSYGMAMTALAVLNLSNSVFEVPTGIWSDGVGRKKTLIAYYLMSALGWAIYYIAHSTPILMMGVIVVGIAYALRSGATEAYVYENAKSCNRESEYQKFEGKRRSFEHLSLVLAAIVGAVIIKLSGLREAILITVGVKVLTVVWAFNLRSIPETRELSGNVYQHLHQAWKQFATQPALRNIGIGKMLAFGWGNAEYRARALYFALLIPEWLINIVGMLANVITAFAMRYADWVVRKAGILRVLVGGEMATRLSIAGLIGMHNPLTPFGMAFINSMMYGLREVGSEHLLQQYYSPAQRATMGSLVGLGASVLYGILGILIGVMADFFGLRNTMLLLQPILAIALVFYWRGIELHQGK